MKSLTKKLALIAVAGSALLAASTPASAIVAKSITIKSAFVGGDWLQIGEIQVFSNGVNVAAASNGATAFGSGWYDASSVPSKAIDGNLSQSYPNIYHSDGAGPTEYLEITFANAVDVGDIIIYARNDTGTERNYFRYELRNPGQYGNVMVYEGILDARTGNYRASASVPLSLPPVPEPASWALMIGGFGIVGMALRRRATRMAFA